MVPEYVVPVDTLPLTNSHKVDKTKLPVASSADRFVATTNAETEWSAEDEARRSIVEAILKIFASVLFVDKPLSPQDNFFLCGGHSLVATKATSLIRHELDVPLPFTAIITSPTASDLAARVEAIKQKPGNASHVPNVIPLRSTPVARPKAMLFVFPVVVGDPDIMPEVVDKLDDGTLRLATYRLVWEPDQGLNTLDKVTDAYAKAISTIAGPTPCFLLGWCYGGIIANHVARRLKDTTKVLLLNAPTPAIVCNNEPKESDHPNSFIEYMCNILSAQTSDLEQVRSVQNQARRRVDQRKLSQTLQDANIDWHDIPRLITFAREHIDLPEWVTDSDLTRYLLHLADDYDVMQDMYENYPVVSSDTAEMERKVVLNLQNRVSLDGFALGLGWSRYEVAESKCYSFAYLEEISSRIVSVLREHIA